MMPKHSLSAGAVVLDEHGKILLIKGPQRGWEFPGGIIELGETIEDGIIREVKEESGIDIEVVRFCGIYQNVKEHICATCWLAKVVGGKRGATLLCRFLRIAITTRTARIRITDSEISAHRLGNLRSIDAYYLGNHLLLIRVISG